MSDTPGNEESLLSRTSAELIARQFGLAGDFRVQFQTELPFTINVPSSPPILFRLANRLFLTRRRRIEFLEPILCGNFRSPAAFLKKTTEMTETLIGVFGSYRGKGPMYFSGKEGALELHALYGELSELIVPLVQRRSASEWLLLLRRCFIAPMDGVSMTPSWFVESFIRLSENPDASNGKYKRSFRIRPNDLGDMHDLLMVATSMWNVGRAFRTVTKGLVVAIAVDPLFIGLAVNSDEAVYSAIAMFEQRKNTNYSDSVLTPGNREGVMRRRFATDPKDPAYIGEIPGFFEYGSSLDRSKHPFRWRTHYRPIFLDPNELMNSKTSQCPSIRSLAAAAVLLLCWDDIGIGKHWWQIRSPLAPCTLWGVHAIDRNRLSSHLQRFTALARTANSNWTVELAMNALTNSSELSGWVVATPSIVLPLNKSHALVDLEQATHAVESAFFRESAGASSREWTSHFEDQVQDLIDHSPWCPPPKALALKGLTLSRKDGSDITDIDAIGMKSGVILLVSVKAWTQPPNLEYGEYGAIQNRASLVEASVNEWITKLTELASHERIASIASGANIVGVVVSPDVQYVLPGRALSEVMPGLKAAVSYLEFEHFLHHKLSKESTP